MNDAISYRRYHWCFCGVLGRVADEMMLSWWCWDGWLLEGYENGGYALIDWRSGYTQSAVFTSPREGKEECHHQEFNTEEAQEESKECDIRRQRICPWSSCWIRSRASRVRQGSHPWELLTLKRCRNALEVCGTSNEPLQKMIRFFPQNIAFPSSQECRLTIKLDVKSIQAVYLPNATDQRNFPMKKCGFFTSWSREKTDIQRQQKMSVNYEIKLRNGITCFMSHRPWSRSYWRRFTNKRSRGEATAVLAQMTRKCNHWSNEHRGVRTAQNINIGCSSDEIKGLPQGKDPPFQNTSSSFPTKIAGSFESPIWLPPLIRRDWLLSLPIINEPLLFI